MLETLELQQQLQEKWTIFWWALGVGLFTLGIAWQKGLFLFFTASPYPFIKGVDVLKGFSYFILSEMIIIPLLFSLFFILKGLNFQTVLSTNPQLKGELNLLVILGGFGSVALAYLGLKKEQKQQLWQQTSVPWYQNFTIGALTWFVSYPLVLAFSQLVSILVWHIFSPSSTEQVAVQHLRKLASSPWLFIMTAMAVVTIIPLTEEFLFRGLLQSWLKQKLNPTLAIILSSFVFALFHYSHLQGITNIELLSSLFLLSCMVGYIYERQRSLWAAIGLHSFFNFISLLMLLNYK